MVEQTRVEVVINPRSGAKGSRAVGDARVAMARGLFRPLGVEPDVSVTERPGDGRELAARALDRGTRLVFAWGGDGTVNEVASALAFGPGTLGIIPSGSGNGLARELGIPSDPAAAVRAALAGHDAQIDAGDLDGRLFFNVAGVGFDAQVAHRFSGAAMGRRGLSSYLWTTGREALRFRPVRMVLDADEDRFDIRPFLVAIANGREWGNGARIAPRARPDDGRLDVVMVTASWAPAVLMRAWRLYTNSFDRASCAITRSVEHVSIRTDAPVPVHVDGEPAGLHTSLSVRVHRGALRVRIP